MLLHSTTFDRARAYIAKIPSAVDRRAAAAGEFAQAPAGCAAPDRQLERKGG